MQYGWYSGEFIEAVRTLVKTWVLQNDTQPETAEQPEEEEDNEEEEDEEE
jgi:hypothetical protein